MSSPLGFDKQGNPISFHRRTRLLRVRVFRAPSGRGTCSNVLDTDGSQLYIDADTEYPVFRQLVGNVPGLYRLDQCDDGGTEVDDAPAAYVTLDQPRNEQAFSSGNDDVSALAVIREMAAVQREMAAIQGQALKALAENHAQILAAAAEVMRAPRPAPLPAELRNAADVDDDNNDHEHDEDDDYEDTYTADEQTPTGMAGMLAQFAKMIDPKDARELGGWLMKKVMEWRREKSAGAAAPAGVPVQVAAPSANVPVAPVHPPTAPIDVAASAAPKVVVQAAPPVIALPISTAGMAAPEANVNTGETATTARALSLEQAGADESDDTADVIGQFPSLSTEQLVHIAMINSQLTPEEQSIAEQVMRRMGHATMQRWLVELSAMSVDEATATVRQAIAERNQRRTKVTR